MNATPAERLTVLAAMPRLPHAEIVVHFDDVIGVLAELAALRASHAKLRMALSDIVKFYVDPMPIGSSGEHMINAARDALAAIPPA